MGREDHPIITTGDGIAAADVALETLGKSYPGHVSVTTSLDQEQTFLESQEAAEEYLAPRMGNENWVFAERCVGVVPFEKYGLSLVRREWWNPERYSCGYWLQPAKLDRRRKISKYAIKFVSDGAGGFVPSGFKFGADALFTEEKLDVFGVVDKAVFLADVSRALAQDEETNGRIIPRSEVPESIHRSYRPGHLFVGGCGESGVMEGFDDTVEARKFIDEKLQRDNGIVGARCVDVFEIRGVGWAVVREEDVPVGDGEVETSYRLRRLYRRREGESPVYIEHRNSCEGQFEVGEDGEVSLLDYEEYYEQLERAGIVDPERFCTQIAQLITVDEAVNANIIPGLPKCISSAEALSRSDLPALAKECFVPGNIRFFSNKRQGLREYTGFAPFRKFLKTRTFEPDDWIYAERYVSLIEVGPYVWVFNRVEDTREGFEDNPCYTMTRMYKRVDGDYQIVSGVDNMKINFLPYTGEGQLVPEDEELFARTMRDDGGISVNGFIRKVSELAATDDQTLGQMIPDGFYTPEEVEVEEVAIKVVET